MPLPSLSALDSLRATTVVDPYTEGLHKGLYETSEGESFLVGTDSPWRAEPRAYRMGDDGVVGTLLVVVLLFVLCVGRRLPKWAPKDKDEAMRKAPAYFRVVLVVALAVLATLYVDPSRMAHPLWLLGAMAAGIGAYFVARWLLVSFAGWVFFEKAKNIDYEARLSRLYAFEAVALFGLAMVGVYSSLALALVVGLGLFLLVSAKVVSVYQAGRIFFNRFYCLLHFIAYLCTLEGLPLLALYALLRFVVGKMAIID